MLQFRNGKPYSLPIRVVADLLGISPMDHLSCKNLWIERARGEYFVAVASSLAEGRERKERPSGPYRANKTSHVERTMSRDSFLAPIKISLAPAIMRTRLAGA